jgi:serine/threonine-protein kinase
LVAGILSAYSTVTDRTGRPELTDSLLRTVLTMRREILGPEHPEYAWTMFNFADHLVRSGRFAEGAHWAREVLKLRGTTLPETHVAVGTALLVLGRALGRLDSLDAAEVAIREGLALRRQNFPAGHWLLASTESMLGEHLVLAGKYRQAESLLVRSERLLVELRGEESQVVNDARRRLIELYTAWKKPTEASQWQARFKPSGAS